MTPGTIRVPPAVRRRLLPAVLALLVPILLARALAAIWTCLAERGITVLHQCVPGGSGSWLATQLALVHAAPNCPSGTLAIGSTPGDTAGIIAAITLPALLLYLAGTLLGFSLASAARGALMRCGQLLRRELVELPAGTSVPTEPTDVVVATTQRHVTHPRLALALAPIRRGPPAVSPT